MLVYFVVIAGLCLILAHWKKQDLKRRQAVVEIAYPGCQPVRKYPHVEPLLGTDLLIKTAKMIHRHCNLPALAERHFTLGKTYLVNSVAQNVFHTVDPANFKAVYETNWHDWGVAPARADALDPFCGKGLITTDGQDWSALREVTKPVFNSDCSASLSSFGQALDQFLDENDESGVTIDLAPLFYEFFLDMGGEFLLGRRLRDIVKSEEKQPPVDSTHFLDAFHGAMNWLIVRVFFGVIGRNLPSPGFNRNCQSVHSFLDFYIDLALEQKLQQGVEASEFEKCTKPGLSHLGMAGMLAGSTGNRHLIRSQLLQSIMCMQETTSSLVTNTMFLLSRHADIWERLRTEVESLNDITLEALENNTLVQNILKESLRIYPIFATSGRTSLQDTALPRGGGPDGLAPVFVPKNSRIITLFYGLHRDAEVFGDDVEAFRPDRWNIIKPGPWEYLPFGNGPRRCPGQEKAMMEAALVVVRFAQRFSRIESRDDRDWAGQWALTVKNAHGCKIALY
ncbi:hypothetical protein G7054_g4410 [Neopestalotiopsis clavispora]|nr:hypothetical protein G7054_g4410 [Neopestalotiopsis clavispora]